MSVSSILLLCLSVSLNGIFIWYIVKLIQEMKYISDSVEYTSGVLKNFSEHELVLPNYVLTVAVVNNLDVLYRINEL